MSPGAQGIRHADRQLPALPGPLRRPQLLHPGSGRALPHPHRQHRRRRRGHHLPVPRGAAAGGHQAAGGRPERLGAALSTSARSRTTRRAPGRRNLNVARELHDVGDPRARSATAAHRRHASPPTPAAAAPASASRRTTSARSRSPTTRTTPPTSSRSSSSPAARRQRHRPGLRRPAQGAVRGQPRRDLRPGQPQPARRPQRASPTRSTDKNITTIALEVPDGLPDAERQQPGHRRLDDRRRCRATASLKTQTPTFMQSDQPAAATSSRSPGSACRWSTRW